MDRGGTSRERNGGNMGNVREPGSDGGEPRIGLRRRKWRVDSVDRGFFEEPHLIVVNSAIAADRVEVFEGHFDEAKDKRENEENDGDRGTVASGIDGFVKVNGKLPSLVEEMGYRISNVKRETRTQNSGAVNDSSPASKVATCSCHFRNSFDEGGRRGRPGGFYAFLCSNRSYFLYKVLAVVDPIRNNSNSYP
jgi:hypothetical protein